jgi:hypothetical protein
MLTQAPPTCSLVTPAADAALHRAQPPRLQQMVVDAIRTRHYSRRT